MASFNWFPGHMNKALKTIEAKLPAIDLVIEIADARAPRSSINHTLHQILGQKPVLTLLSKIDWADSQVTNQWLDWYRRKEMPVDILNYRDRHFSQKLVKKINLVLDSKLKKWKSKGILKPQLNVLVIGIPNVGKSTFINHLLKKHKAITANRPGVTRGLQLIELSPTINLIDSPGVLPAKLEDWNIAVNLVAINSIKIGIYPLWEVGKTLIETLYSRYPQHFHNYYHFTPKMINSVSSDALFKAIATGKNKTITSTLDWEKQIIQPFINDLANGKLKISFEQPEENLSSKT